MAEYHLAQLNIARMRGPIDSPIMAEFVANLDRINAVADGFTGFVWRLQTEEGDATGFRPLGDDMLVNMSVWESLEALHEYVFKSAHVEIMKMRRQWFELMREAYVVLWWVEAGHIPSIEEAVERLEMLQSRGPSEPAFNFRSPYPAPGDGKAAPARTFLDECPAT